MCLEAVKPESRTKIEIPWHYYIINDINDINDIIDINDINDTNHDDIVNICKAENRNDGIDIALFCFEALKCGSSGTSPPSSEEILDCQGCQASTFSTLSAQFQVHEVQGQVA